MTDRCASIFLLPLTRCQPKTCYLFRMDSGALKLTSYPPLVLARRRWQRPLRDEDFQQAHADRAWRCRWKPNAMSSASTGHMKIGSADTSNEGPQARYPKSITGYKQTFQMGEYYVRFRVLSRTDNYGTPLFGGRTIKKAPHGQTTGG